MAGWTDGYVTEIGYTYGYYQEQNPLRLAPAFINAGLLPPQVRTACDIGFGQGVSSNIHAAATDIQWFGTDFNPSQAGFAQELAKICGSGARFFDQSFAEFCSRDDLPNFDMIVLHGIWSWISMENRQILLDFIRRKLSVGGVLYVSYNTPAGWAAIAPLRELMALHSDAMSAPSVGMERRIDAAMKFAEQVLEIAPLYSQYNPAAQHRLKKMKEGDRRYLAHEYFNRNWTPMSFAETARHLEAAKLSFASPATFNELIDAINLTGDQIKFLKEIQDASVRETTRDLLVNQQFRRDYWARGMTKMSAYDQRNGLENLRLVLAKPIPEIASHIRGARGEAKLQPEVYEPIFAAISDHAPFLVKDLQAKLKNMPAHQLSQAIFALLSLEALQVAQMPVVVAQRKPVTDRLNQYLLSKAIDADEIGVLASPVTGAGYRINRFQQLFLYARSKGEVTKEAWVKFASDLLIKEGRLVGLDGRPVAAEDVKAGLLVEASQFESLTLPCIQALQIID